MNSVKVIKKGWGSETIFVSNDEYCGKLLNFEAGKKFSMHFHRYKDETWYILSGKYIVKVIKTHNAKQYEKELNPGDVWRNVPCLPHQIICVESGSIIEVSTPDSIEDNYRILPGDSQK